ncbi:hypothetical protein [Pseudoduganella umbonata]|uniref:Uncharacterized protein n=1 Tax=Pseudoduganella umbonata TaxID=864828 RepID=A0A4P8HL03_9BURK|nr:hypothetical protein [Pseudoduganella umbonata]MBB3221170.1 hypothetical protein [Pseudoduganella umbonata]QCP10363.1 hypothetical protein FCL38_07900 [Pseudoduganella umbonata]
MKKILPLLLLLSLPGAPAALAGEVPGGWGAVDETVLANARGGFDAGNGLLVSLSVDRLLSMNGNVVASSQLAVPDVAKAAASGAGLSSFHTAQAGAGNALAIVNQPLAGLVLQNSASDQLIRAQTTIDATVNSLGVLKDMNFSDSLRQALSTSIAPR